MPIILQDRLLKKLRAIFGVAFFCVCLATPHTAMADFSVALTEVARMDWATIAIPASGSATVILHPSNTTPGGTGTILYGMPNRGQYKLVLSGTGPETSMTLDISSVNSGSGNLTLSNFTGIYNSTSINSFPSGTLAIPATGAGTTLYLGATATVTAGQAATTVNPSFDIDMVLN
jgi:hypothetical protein